MRLLLILALVACSNDVDPEVIEGGGVGYGEIDGEVNVHVVDQSDNPISGATVQVYPADGGELHEKTTDAKGLVVVSGVEGAQTIVVKATGYRSAVWVGANGANVTIPLAANAATAIDSAMLSGSITGWDSITVPTGHIKAAVILYSQNDEFGDQANDLQTPSMGNLCIGGSACNWTLLSRTGPVTVTAVIVDRDGKGTPLDPMDDTQTIVGYAYRPNVMVEKGVTQSGLTLAMIETGNLETITIDEGTPPAGLTEVISIAGIEVTSDEIIQIPVGFVDTNATQFLVPKRSVFGGTATYRLTSIASTTSGEMGAQSIILRQGLTDTTLDAGTWLVTPTGVQADRISAKWEKVSNANLTIVTWADAQNELLEITVLDSQKTEVIVPNLVDLPTSGTLTARVLAVGSDLDLNDFSLESDSDLIWGASGQPVSIP